MMARSVIYTCKCVCVYIIYVYIYIYIYMHIYIYIIVCVCRYGRDAQLVARLYVFRSIFLHELRTHMCTHMHICIFKRSVSKHCVCVREAVGMRQQGTRSSNAPLVQALTMQTPVAMQRKRTMAQKISSGMRRKVMAFLWKTTSFVPSPGRIQHS